MKLVGNSHNDCFNLGVCQHRVVIRKSFSWLEPGCYLLDKILRQVANGVQFRVTCFQAGLQVRGLRNRSAAENSYPQ